MSGNRKYYYILRDLNIVHAVVKLIVDLYNKKNVLWEVKIEPLKKTRTLQQSRYYWAILEMIGDYLGYTSEEVHELFKNEFLEPTTKEIKIKDKDGNTVIEKEIILPPSTTRLKTDEFCDYIENIAMFMSNLGFVVPPPAVFGYEITREK